MRKVNELTTNKMVNLVSKETKNGNVIISMEDSKYYYLPFDKSYLDLSDPKIRTSFIKPNKSPNVISSEMNGASFLLSIDLCTDCDNITVCTNFLL